MASRAGGYHLHRLRGISFSAALLAAAFSAPALAADPPAPPGAAPAAPREPDAPPDTPRQISEHFSVGFRVGEETDLRRDMDLDSATPDNYFSHEPQIQIAAHYNIPNTFRFFAILRLRKEYAVQEQGAPVNRRYFLQLDDAYISAPLPFGNTVASLGRIRMPDYRSWVYSNSQVKNEALHVIHRGDGKVLQFAVVTKELIPRNLLHPIHIDRTLNYVGSAEYNLADNIRATGVLLYQDNLAFDNRDRTYLTLRSRGTFWGALDYWADFSHVRGSNGPDKMRGYAADVGATLKFGHALAPHVTASYALGSGDDDPTDGVDRSFRHTGVNENRHHFGGVTRFKYYGEILDPELSNIGVLTLAAGFKPSLISSVDVIYHSYRRVKPGGAMSLNVDQAPSAPGHDLGQEVDLVLGYRNRSEWEFEALAGYFVPGAIFGPTRSDAARILLKAKYNF